MLTHEILTRGLLLSAVGLGGVFSFLALLTVCTALMSRVVVALHGESLHGETASHSHIDLRLVAAVTAAVNAHRAARRGHGR